MRFKKRKAGFAVVCKTICSPVRFYLQIEQRFAKQIDEFTPWNVLRKVGRIL
jgi:hypothetical protein